jgi:hypothetical protein
MQTFIFPERQMRPAVVHSGYATHVFAIDYDGKLLEFRRPDPAATWTRYDRSWYGAAPGTRGGELGASVINGVPLVCMVAQDKTLLCWTPTPQGWIATNLSNAPGGAKVTGRPAVTSKGHVYARSETGRLMQWVRNSATCADSQCWTAWNVYPSGVTMEGNPIVVEKPGAVHVFARGSHGKLIEYYKQSNPAPWFQYDHSWIKDAVEMQGDPSAALIDGSMQVFAISTDGKLQRYNKTPGNDPWTFATFPDASSILALSGSPIILSSPGRTRVAARTTEGDRRLIVADSTAQWLGRDVTAALQGLRPMSAPSGYFDSSTGLSYLYFVDQNYGLTEVVLQP